MTSKILFAALLLSTTPALAAPGAFICTTSENSQSSQVAMKQIQDFLNKSCDATKPYSISGGRSDWDNGDIYTFGACCISK